MNNKTYSFNGLFTLTVRFFCIQYRKEMGIEPNAIFLGNWIWIGIGAVCHLPVCYIQPIYLSELERKSDGQCEQVVINMKNNVRSNFSSPQVQIFGWHIWYNHYHAMCVIDQVNLNRGEGILSVCGQWVTSDHLEDVLSWSRTVDGSGGVHVSTWADRERHLAWWLVCSHAEIYVRIVSFIWISSLNIKRISLSYFT